MKTRLYTKKSNSGSSLILVLMVVAGIVSVIFSAERVSLVQFAQTEHESDNTQALYAARAGIEDGLARYRFSRDTETLETGSAKDSDRVDVTTGQKIGQITAGDAISQAAGYHPTDQYYDLNIQYRASSLGDFNDSTKAVAAKKDESFRLTGFPDIAQTNHNNSDYYLRYKVYFPQGAPASCLVQFQQSRQDQSGTVTFDQAVAKPTNDANLDGAVDSASETQNLLIRTLAGGSSNDVQLTSSVTVKVFGCNVGLAFQTVEAQNGSLSAGVDFDSLTTTVTSTGYYGAAKRTFIAKIDRKSDKVIDVYEYTLYAGQGSIKPR